MSYLPPPQSYATQPPPTVSYISQSARTTTTVATSLSTRPSSTHTTSRVTGNVPSTLPSSSTSPSASVTSPPNFVQLAAYTGTTAADTSTTTAYAFIIPADSVASANYQQICPQGDCYKDCQNLTRVFESVPDGIVADPSTYGKATGGFPNVTLFGVCTNLGVMSELGPPAYFPNNATAVQHANADISMCLLDTCQKTRDPLQCMDSCAIDVTRPGNMSVSADSISSCMSRLCSNTCGLPYANQDVFGVGLLASYITQAVLVLVLAVVFIGSASWHFFRRNQKSSSSSLKDGLEAFLTAQCYFGISAVVASYFMHPPTIDPLNGYALLSVSITGFLPTVFTLMLLHSRGIKSWYATFLTCASWLFSSVLFFVLVQNLRKSVHSHRLLDQGLNSLFNIQTCGGSSAMSLCRQMFDTDPMFYLSNAYNYWTVPNIDNVPVLWVLSTVVLLILVALQIYNAVSARDRKFNSVVGLGALYLGSILFGLALGSQARMVIAYTRMDVIDWHGWTFGQVVALLFWVPALIDCVRSYVRQLRESAPSDYSKLDKLGSMPPTPMPAQSSPSLQSGFEPLRNVQQPGEGFQRSSIARKPVATERATTT